MENLKRMQFRIYRYKLKEPLYGALCLNLFFLALYFAFGQIRHGSLDDYFMSCVLTGAYGANYDIHTYFVNAAYGIFLKPYYWIFPKVGWYFIFELLGTFCAFTTFTFFIIRQLGCKYGIVISAIFLASFTPDFYFQLSFTQCATAYSAAGIVSTIFGIFERQKKFLLLVMNENLTYEKIANDCIVSLSIVKMEMAQVCKIFGVKNKEALKILLLQYKIEP